MSLSSTQSVTSSASIQRNTRMLSNPRRTIVVSPLRSIRFFFLGSPGASLPSMTFHIQSRANRDSPQCVFQAPDHGRTQEPFCRCSIQVASQGSPIEEVLGRHRPTHNCHQPTFRLCRNFIRGALRFLGTVYPFMTEGGAVPTALSSCWKCSLRRVT